MSVVPFNPTRFDNLITADLVIVADLGILGICSAAIELMALLIAKAGLDFIRLETISDPKGMRYLVHSRNIVFLMGQRNYFNTLYKQYWLEQLDTVNLFKWGKFTNHFSVYLVDFPMRMRNNTAFQREIMTYQNSFEWLPYLLKAIFGTNKTVVSRPTIWGSIKEEELSNTFVDTFNNVDKMLDELVNVGEQVHTDDYIILLHGDTVNAEDQKMLRNKKLNGKFIHAYVIYQNTTIVDAKLETADLCWYTHRQNSTNSEGSFIISLMFDMGVIRTKHEQLLAVDKIPARQIATPIMVQRPTQSSVTLRWSGLREHTDKSRIIVQRRSNISQEWSQIVDTLPGTSSSFTATDLQQFQKYQFALIVESFDNVSKPTLSEWISIEDREHNVRKCLNKLLWVLLLIVVAILDLPEVFLLMAALTIMALTTLPIRLFTFCTNLKVIEFVWKERTKEIIICLYIVFLVVYLSTAWMIPKSVYQCDTLPLCSPIYIVPPLYMLLWSITSNVVSYKFFECEYGVFSIPGRIRTNIKWTGINVRVHVSSEVDTVMSVSDIE